MSPQPWMKIDGDELPVVCRLPPRELRVWLALRYLGRNGWAIRRRDVEGVAGLSKRHVQLALVKLEQLGAIRRAYCGARKDSWGRFRVDTTAILQIAVQRSGGSLHSDPGDHPQRSPGSLHTTLGSDRSEISDPSLPESLSGSAREEPGREGGREVPGELEQAARELWPNVATAPARRYLAQLCELAPDQPAAELAAYLRHAAADPTLERAALPLAAACTADRLEPWLRRRRKRAPKRAERAPDSGERLSAAESAALAADALRALK